MQSKYRELAEERERVLAADVKETEQLKEELAALKRHLKLVEVCFLLTNSETLIENIIVWKFDVFLEWFGWGPKDARNWFHNDTMHSVYL